MNSKSMKCGILVFLALIVGVCPTLGQETKPVAVGDVAPSIVASEWVRGEPILKYEPGQVYVIDLWSTWCKGCISSMPELRIIEKKYGNKVTVIAMNIWEIKPEGVPKFMAKNGEIMPGHVAMDLVPEGKEANEGITAMAFIGTSEKVTIPKTFLIDQNGKVAWIGLPGDLDTPLSKVLDGSWDLDGEVKRSSTEAEIEDSSVDKE